MKLRKLKVLQLPFIKKPLLAFYFWLVKVAGILMGDRKYLEFRYKLLFKEKPDLDNPTTFNEKLNWLKLYNRKSEYSSLVNKYDVKSYVTATCGGGACRTNLWSMGVVRCD